LRLSIYEINTAVWLGGHSLADVPARRWDAIAALPVDAVWLMGVWQRSPAGREIALQDPASYRGGRAEDVIGSPYCVSAGGRRWPSRGTSSRRAGSGSSSTTSPTTSRRTTRG
jgi:hypothetical protein